LPKNIIHYVYQKWKGKIGRNAKCIIKIERCKGGFSTLPLGWFMNGLHGRVKNPPLQEYIHFCDPVVVRVLFCRGGLSGKMAERNFAQNLPCRIVPNADFPGRATESVDLSAKKYYTAIARKRFHFGKCDLSRRSVTL